MEAESTVEEQSAGDIRDELLASMDESAEEPVEEIHEEVIDDVSEEVDEEVSEEGEEVSENVGLEAPQHWSQKDRELFSQQTPEAQQFLLDRHKAMEGDYTRKMQERSDFDKTYQPIQQLLEPHLPALQAAGVNQTQYLTNLMMADKMLRDNPAEGIQHVAQMYGVDLGDVAAAPPPNPELQRLRGELTALRTELQQRDYQSQQSSLNTATQKIESFATQADEQGNPLHPYFDRVVDDMVSMAQAERVAGREPQLEELYERATWANPEIRKEMQQAQQKAAEQKAIQEASAKAKQAKKASASVKGNGDAPSADIGLREQIAALYDGG